MKHCVCLIGAVALAATTFGCASLHRNRPQPPAGFIYTVQIGLYQDKRSARDLEALARQRSESDVYIVFEEPFFRVRVGAYTSQREAERAVDKLMGMGFRDARWIRVKANGQ